MSIVASTKSSRKVISVISAMSNMPVMPTIYDDGVTDTFSYYGTQDEVMEDPKYVFDIRETFLKDRHRVVYTTFETKQSWNDNSVSIKIIPGQCDYINTVALVLECDAPYQLHSIETEIGGHRIDKCYEPEVTLAMNCKFFGTDSCEYKMKTFGNKKIIPLVMAPFYKQNLVYARTLHHEINIIVKFASSIKETVIKASLMGGLISMCPLTPLTHLSPTIHPLLSLYERNYVMQTYQTQHTGKEKMVRGQNTYALNYYHPVDLLYAWGFDRSKVTNIKIQFRKGDKENPTWHVYYDGAMDELEYYKIHNVDAMVFYFSRDPFFQKTNSTINFSRMDHANLVITTDEEGEREISIGCISSQPMLYRDGMLGLQFM